MDATVRAGALYGGLVFHARSPRFVPLEQARGLADRMRGGLKIVALIADMDDAGIEAIVKSVRPDFLQLHGSETLQRTAEIRSDNFLAINFFKKISMSSHTGICLLPFSQRPSTVVGLQ